MTYIPELIDNGIHILNPVQTSARNMDPAELKTKFGRDLVFWGAGCDAQHLLPNGTPEQVAQHVRNILAAFMPDNGYVFNNVHNIQGDVPPQNILALYDTAYDHGFYA
jgi:uroporphyrinogen decarboxylase